MEADEDHGRSGREQKRRRLELVQAGRCVYSRRLPGATYHVFDYIISLRKWLVPPTAGLIFCLPCPPFSSFSNLNFRTSTSILHHHEPPPENAALPQLTPGLLPEQKKTRLRRSDLPSSTSWIAAPELCTSCLTPKSIHQTHTPAVTREARLSEVTLQQTTVANQPVALGFLFAINLLIYSSCLSLPRPALYQASNHDQIK